ncbi:MAG: hypothetical protein LQ345_002059 [Seirophora villosa]|nr:MAG: hypothetical protein LQ345_002059 [Seirophora villosa]
MSPSAHTRERPSRRVSHHHSRGSRPLSSSRTPARAVPPPNASAQDIAILAAEAKLDRVSPPLGYVATNDGAIYRGRHHTSRTRNDDWMQADDGSWWHTSSPSNPRHGGGVVDVRFNLHAQAARDPEIRAYVDFIAADTARRRLLPRDHPDHWPSEEEEARIVERQFRDARRGVRSPPPLGRIPCGEGYIDRAGSRSSSRRNDNGSRRAPLTAGSSSRADERPEMPPTAPLPRLHGSRHESTTRPGSRR